MAAPPARKRMPAIFVGHGSPMNAIEENEWSRAFRALGATLPKPRAILCVSAHWYIRGTATTGDERPRTIHDFGGFPKALEEMLYDVPGDPDLAKRVVAILGPDRAKVRDDWGLDHGTWSVLHHIRPDRDVPVVQLSIDRQSDGARHIEIAKAVGALRDEGVLILGSGNVTHNLRFAMSATDDSVPDWAARFDESVAKAAESSDTKYLARALTTQDGARSHPTPDHYIPVLYAAGASLPGDRVTFPITGFAGSLSMRAIQWS